MTDLTSDSEGSTILLSPGSGADDIVNANQNDVFAWLRPHSDIARRAFDASVNSALKNRGKYEHIRQFLQISERGNRALSAFTEDGAENHDVARQWSGAFRLSLKVPPRDSAKGWYFGTSRGRHLQDVNILLAPPIKKWAGSRIAGRHGRLFLHEESCRMMLEARHTVTTTKNGAFVISQLNSRVVEHGELIEIGDCTYTFEYAELYSTPGFEEDLVRFMKEHNGPRWALNKLLSPASVNSSLPMGNYSCSPSAFAQGTFGKIYAGWSHNGRPVAIKVFKRPVENEVRGHQELMAQIGYHVSKVPNSFLVRLTKIYL